MPSSNRLADAANITPYLTHRINHHGQPTLIPPDSQGRVRKGKAKKPRPRQDRRPDDEPRFNVGSPRPRLQPGNGRGRGPTRIYGRQGRRDDEDLAIPDYPPPSFLEAISTPIAVSPAVVWPCINVPSETSCSIPPAVPPSELPSTHRGVVCVQHRLDTPPQSLLVNPSDSDSPTDGSSLEVVELDPSQTQWDEDRTLGLSLEARVEREYQRMVVQTSTPSSSSHDVSRTAPPEFLIESRGRTGRGVLDSDHESEAKTETTSSATRAKIKHLAPLRVLSLSPSKPTPERAFSARPIGSPYSFARTGSQFLRSTTSLCKIPLSTSAPSVGSESTVTRRLFTSKGKERAHDLPCIEPLDSWEMVDSDQPESPMESPKSPKRFFFPRLVSVPPIHRSHDRVTPQSPSADTSSRTHEHFLPGYPTECAPSRPDKSTQSSTSFLYRQVRRAPPPPPPRLTPFTPASSPPVSPISTSPSTYSSRTFISSLPSSTPVAAQPNPPPPSPSRKNQYNESPLTIPYSRKTDVDDPQATPTHRHALSFPFQTSPPAIHHDHIPESPVTPTSDRIESHHGNTLYRLLVPSSKTGNTPTQNYTAPPSPTSHRSPERSESHTTSLSPRWTPMAPRRILSPLSISEPVPTRHHYPGRPLPRPPPPVTGACRIISDVSKVGHCPEGLLIDFDGPVCTNDDQCPSPSTSPVKSQRTPRETVPRPTSPESHRSHSLVNSLRHPDVLLPCPSDSFSAPHPSPSRLSVNVDSFSLQACGENRSNPDTLSRNVMFTGRTNPLQSVSFASGTQGAQDPPTDSSPNHLDHRRPVATLVTSTTGFGTSVSSSALAGQIEVDRRRMTKDGRVKLKLSLLGLAVDRCGICLSQFKGGEWAEMGEVCRHAFHQQCLGHWMERSRTCPLCRLPWDECTNQ